MSRQSASSAMVMIAWTLTFFFAAPPAHTQTIPSEYAAACEANLDTLIRRTGERDEARRAERVARADANLEIAERVRVEADADSRWHPTAWAGVGAASASLIWLLVALR